jgi:predicted phage terminase large subunit-like protein
MLEDGVVSTLEECGEMMDIPVRSVLSKKVVWIGKNKVILRSGEKPEEIRAFKCGHVWIDEGSYLKNNACYLRAIGRMSANPNGTVYITSSPKGKDWVYELSKQDDCLLLTQSLSENYFLSEKFYETLLKEYGGPDSPFAKQELEGLVVSFGDKYFPTERIKYNGYGVITHLVQAFDLAFTEHNKSDYTAYALCGVDNNNNFIVLHVERHRFKIPQIKQLIKAKLNEINCPCIVDAQGPQIAVYDDLIADPDLYGHTIIPWKSVVSKPIKNIGLATAMYSGRVYFNSAPWNKTAIEELDEFREDMSHDHDDQGDAISMCFNYTKGSQTSLCLSGSI